ncbi:hypothetical protein HQ403_02025 [Candidatus Kaiserbacteria bacterium]|nr:hypothetical protein [Candidatus Kaiserbacteria bacterium]
MPTEQELEKLYNALPQNTKDLLTSPNTAREVTRLAEKYSLNPSNTDMLLNEVGLVLLGVEDPNTFADDLMEVLGMEKEQADNLTRELTHTIFSLAEKPKEVEVVNEVDVKESLESDADAMRELLRKNSKTVNIKNLIANLK